MSGSPLIDAIEEIIATELGFGRPIHGFDPRVVAGKIAAAIPSFMPTPEPARSVVVLKLETGELDNMVKDLLRGVAEFKALLEAASQEDET